MSNNKKIVGLSLLILLGLILASCAQSTETEPVDPGAQSGSEERTMFVGPLLVDCEGEGPQKCMLVKENPEDEYTLFYDQIEGFSYEEIGAVLNLPSGTVKSRMHRAVKKLREELVYFKPGSKEHLGDLA